MHETPRVNLGILHVVKNLGSGTPIAIILAKTLNGLDVVHRKEATFFVGESSPSSSMIPNFCLMQWAVELSQFNIKYKPRLAIKA